MTMVHTLCCFALGPKTTRTHVACRWLVGLVVCFGAAARLSAQAPNLHYRHQGEMPPGAIGAAQLQRGGPLRGYFQPVKIMAPFGAMVSLAIDGAFTEPMPAPLTVGMQIAPVYRLRITQIPQLPGQEVFPTIEVIDRLYPPPQAAVHFPIPIELTHHELQLALAGKFVTRVIYLEDSDNAIPADESAGQHWFDAGPGANPLEVADRLGRPVAILRMGGRVPDERNGPDAHFLGGCPAVKFYPQVVPAEQVHQAQAAPEPREEPALPTRPAQALLAEPERP